MEHKQTIQKTDPGQTRNKTWGFAESFLIGFEILVLGFVTEVLLGGQGIRSPHAPYNILILFILVVALLIAHAFYRNKPVIKWLSSVPCSISAISIYALMVLLLGFIPQEGDSQPDFLRILGLTHAKNSWPFLLIQFYLLVSLGMVVLRKGIPLSKKNAGFVLNHFGLWVTLVSAGFGSGDLRRVTVNLYEKGDFIRDGILNSSHEKVELPFSMKLIDFDIDLYNPKLAVADGIKGKIIEKHGETLPVIHRGFETTLIDWEIKVKEFMPFAIKTDSGFIESEVPGNMAVAFVETKNKVTADTVSGWLTSGSLSYDPRYLELGNSELLILTAPEPRKFSSKIQILDSKGVQNETQLEVNKPFRVHGWKLYQISYDTRMGKLSTLSVIEAVRDPWLPVVYAGVFMLLGGALYLFWLGRGAKTED